jgi:hypothetical protein
VTDARICAPEEPRPPSRRVGLAPTGKAPPCHGARGFRTFAGTRSDDKLAPQVDCFEAKARPSPSWRACDSLAASVLNVRSRSKYRWRSPCCGRGAARTGDRCGTGNACTAAPSRISYRGCFTAFVPVTTMVDITAGIASTAAARATPAPSSRHRSGRPLQRGRARPDDGIPCTTR